MPTRPFRYTIRVTIRMNVMNVTLIGGSCLTHGPRVPRRGILLNGYYRRRLVRYAGRGIYRRYLLISPGPLICLRLVLFLHILLRLRPTPLRPRVTLIRFHRTIHRLCDLQRHLLELHIYPTGRPEGSTVYHDLYKRPRGSATRLRPINRSFHDNRHHLNFTRTRLYFRSRSTQFLYNVRDLRGDPLRHVKHGTRPRHGLLQIYGTQLYLPQRKRHRLFPHPIRPHQMVLRATRLLCQGRKGMFHVTNGPIYRSRGSNRGRFLLQIRVLRLHYIIGTTILRGDRRRLCPRALPSLFLSLKMMITLPSLWLVVSHHTTL